MRYTHQGFLRRAVRVTLRDHVAFHPCLLKNHQDVLGLFSMQHFVLHMFISEFSWVKYQIAVTYRNKACRWESSLNRQEASSPVIPCIPYQVSVIMAQVNWACFLTAIVPCQPQAGLLWMASVILHLFRVGLTLLHCAVRLERAQPEVRRTDSRIGLTSARFCPWADAVNCRPERQRRHR